MNFVRCKLLQCLLIALLSLALQKQWLDPVVYNLNGQANYHRTMLVFDLVSLGDLAGLSLG